jgi:hypothetical protein
MMTFYAQNQTEGIPGKLTDTWYVAGAMFMTLIQYWQASGDDQYNSIVSHDLMFQAGRNFDFFDSNYSRWLVGDSFFSKHEFFLFLFTSRLDRAPYLLSVTGERRPDVLGSGSHHRVRDRIP